MNTMAGSQCPLCLTTASTRDALVRHISIHHRTKDCRIILHCFQCQKIFQNLETLLSHRETEHGTSQQRDNQAIENSRQLILEAGHRCHLEETLQSRAAQLLHNLRDEGNATQFVTNSVIHETDEICDLYLDLIQSAFCEAVRKSENGSLPLETICHVLDGFRQNSLFEGLQSEKRFMNFLAKKQWLAAPDQVVVERKEVLKKNMVVSSIPVKFGYAVPFETLLEKVLNLPEVLYCIDHPKPVQEGKYTSPLDGLYYRNHPLVKKYPGTLAFGFYVDDVQPSDKGSTKHLSGRFAYWNLLNIYPELRSSPRAINLIFAAQTEFVKEYGFDAFLEDYIKGMQKLSSDEGLKLIIMGKERIFHGIQLVCCGDNPASANVAGFKESHFADLPCRQCMGTKPEIYESFVEESFQLRSKETHEQHVKEVEQYLAKPSAWPKDKKNPSVKYGVNSRSVFMKIPNFDCTVSFVQDLMHDVILGTLKLEIICLLNHAIGGNFIKLDTVNDRIMKYAKYFGVNKPSRIETAHLKEEILYHSAAETLSLAQILPFALLKEDDTSGVIESVCDTENLECYILRLNLLNLQMATEFTDEDVKHLIEMTKTHHEKFLKLYPKARIPKLHYEIHSPRQIIFFGPLRQHWCMRFEAKHAYFKRLTKILHCFKNLFLSLTKRHQMKQAAQMLFSVQGDKGPYLKTADYCSAAQVIKVSNLKNAHKELVLHSFPGISPNSMINQYTYVVVKGVHYSEKDAFVLSFCREVPLLGEIVRIYGLEEKVVFIYSTLVTEKYESSLNAFKVKHEGKLAVALTSDIIHHQRIPFIKSVNAHYIIISCRSFLASLILD